MRLFNQNSPMVIVMHHTI